MKIWIIILIIANMIVSCSSTEQSSNIASETPKPSKVNFKNEPLPDIQLYSGMKFIFKYEKDNAFEPLADDVKIFDAIIEFIRVNPSYTIYMRSYMHENEIAGTNEKRALFFKERAKEAGIGERKILATIIKPLLPQGEIDEFSPEEIIDARRIEIQIIK